MEWAIKKLNPSEKGDLRLSWNISRRLLGGAFVDFAKGMDLEVQGERELSFSRELCEALFLQHIIIKMKAALELLKIYKFPPNWFSKK